jgi:hypothetical protein
MSHVTMAESAALFDDPSLTHSSLTHSLARWLNHLLTHLVVLGFDVLPVEADPLHKSRHVLCRGVHGEAPQPHLRHPRHTPPANRHVVQLSVTCGVEKLRAFGVLASRGRRNGIDEDKALLDTKTAPTLLAAARRRYAHRSARTHARTHSWVRSLDDTLLMMAAKGSADS